MPEPGAAGGVGVGMHAHGVCLCVCVCVCVKVHIGAQRTLFIMLALSITRVDTSSRQMR